MLKQIAVGLEVPVTASLDDIRQLVDGKLVEIHGDQGMFRLYWVMCQEE